MIVVGIKETGEALACFKDPDVDQLKLVKARD